MKELVLAAMLLGSRDVVGGIKFVDSLARDQKDLQQIIKSSKKSCKGYREPPASVRKLQPDQKDTETWSASRRGCNYDCPIN